LVRFDGDYSGQEEDPASLTPYYEFTLCFPPLPTSLTDPSMDPYPHQFATALFSFLYHLASYDAGGEALVSCGMMEALLKVVPFFLRLLGGNQLRVQNCKFGMFHIENNNHKKVSRKSYAYLCSVAF
jgi:hypothetical protein